MADSTVASVKAIYEVDVAQLSRGLGQAQTALKGFEGAAMRLDKQLTQANTTFDKTVNAHAALAKMGIRTGESIEAEIKSLDELAVALQGDAVAMKQLIERKQQLQSVLGTSASGFNKMGAANHRANLFLINFSRGVEDLKFGLPAVINNLEGIALGFQMMSKEAKAAGGTATAALMATITSPAGILALMNLVVTTAFLLGPTLKKAFGQGVSGAKELKDAVGEILGDLKVESSFKAAIPTDPKDVRELAASFKNYTAEMLRAGAATGRMEENWMATRGALTKVMTPTKEFAAELKTVGTISKEVQKKLDDYATSLEAMAIVAEKVKKKLAEVGGLRFQGDAFKSDSITALGNKLQGLEESFDGASAKGRATLLPMIIKLRAELEKLEIKKIVSHLPGSIDDITQKIEKLELAFTATNDAVKRMDIDKELIKLRAELGNITWKWENLVDVTDEYAVSLEDVELELGSVIGTFGFVAEATRSMEERMATATTATERLSIASEMFALNKGPAMERALMDINDALTGFKDASILKLGASATDGFFDGLFGGFKKADADSARLTLIEMNKEFGSLEEALASGDISFEEFTIRNRMRMAEMDEAQRELALATRTNFELMADRIGNAFEGLKDSVINAFKEIAAEYVKLQVKKGLIKILATIGGDPTGGAVATNALGFRASSASPTIGIKSIGTILPSGDLRLSVQQAGLINSRTGI